MYNITYNLNLSSYSCSTRRPNSDSMKIKRPLYYYYILCVRRFVDKDAACRPRDILDDEGMRIRSIIITCRVEYFDVTALVYFYFYEN